MVWSDQFNVTEGIAETNPFTGVTKIIVVGGAGGDVIDLSGVQAGHGVTVEASGGAENDTINGGGEADNILVTRGTTLCSAEPGPTPWTAASGIDRVFGDAGADVLFGGEGNDVLDGGTEDDTLSGGTGNDEFVRSGGADVVDLGDAGSVDAITGGGGDPILNLADKATPVTVFIKDARILVGFGKQNMSSSAILGTTFTSATRPP